MQLEHIFEKNISRPIEGVIKADDEASLRLELDEYVITDEVSKRLDAFLDAYLNYSGANGVWISGFFGSGKSHLLKMLAMLLENRNIDGVSALDIFLQKPKCRNDEIFSSDLKRAIAIPSESILFNIDQKADVISKKELDALLAVFVKVFDEHCGYYGKQPYIAHFERELDADGLFEAFKTEFQNQTGQDWKWGRSRANRMAADIDAAYNKVTSQTATNILDKYRNDYRLSIEDFAEQVKSYIDKRGDTFRLNFFVDEVGQYVADNVKLMTNLQTVAESLATRCNGQAWVIVTAQEDMTTVVGEVGKQQSNDFSKIQARFKNRMKLTSQDVAEVIQRRLLQKKEEYIAPISDLYHQQENNFKTLFDFSDGAQNYRNFRDREHFIQCYPFIPYQFTLFQAAIQNLSLHNAFEGEHSSVGERSMLGVFQQVAIAIKGHEMAEIATFDLMFEGIRTALKTSIQQSILRAEKNLDNAFAIQLLKALFLVKYVKEFKPTVRNLCVLMYNSFNRDIPELKQQVEEALSLLEKETYIQRSGDLYEYLTDEEQDIEKEIKNTEVESSSVAQELVKLIYDGVIKHNKIRSLDNNQDYPYSRRLDDNLTGREYELSINVITPFHDYPDAEEKHRTDTIFKDELRVLLPASERLMRDLMMYKRTEKYVAHETRATQQDTVKRILTEKGIQNTERMNQLKLLTNKLMGAAKYFVAGRELDLSGDDGQSKVVRAFHELINTTHTNLSMLRGVQFSENDIPGILKKGTQGLFGDEAALPESEAEMLSSIKANDREGIRNTLKSVLEKFEHKPYGWSYAAVLCTLAYLCARAKVEVTSSSNPLDEAELAKVLTNTAQHANLILKPMTEYTQAQVRAAKQFYSDMFDKVMHATEAKAIGKEIQTAFHDLAIELDKYLAQSDRYPFLAVLLPVVSSVREIEGKPYDWFLIDLVKREDKWLDLKENTIDPAMRLMKGQQKEVFDVARQLLLTQRPNLEYFSADAYQAIEQALADVDLFKGNKVQQLKISTEQLQQKLRGLLEKEQIQAKESVKSLCDKLKGFEQFNALNEACQQELLSAFDTTLEKIARHTLVASIRDDVRRFEDETYASLVQKLSIWSQPTKAKPAAVTGVMEVQKGDDLKPSSQPEAPVPEAPVIQTLPLRQVKVAFKKPWLESEQDVDDYLGEYKKALIEAIKAGKQIQL